MPEQVDIFRPPLPHPDAAVPVGVMVAGTDEHGDLHPLQGPADGLVPLPGVGAVEDIAGEQHQIAALPDAQLRDLSGHLQQARPELAALPIGKFPQGGIDVPVCGV